MKDDTLRDLLGIKPKVGHDEKNISDYPVDILSFDNNLLGTNITQGETFKGKRSGMIHNLTMDVDSGFKYIEKFGGGIQWYMMISKGFNSNINFKLTNEKGELVSFNRLSLTFRLSIKEVYCLFLLNDKDIDQITILS